MFRSANILFDNIFIGDDASIASEFATQTFKHKNNLESQLEQSENPSRNLFQVLLDATEERPWLWIVYALCFIIPCIAIGVYFFGRKSATSSDSDAKKTDAYQPDDEEEDEDKDELLNVDDAQEVEDQPGPSTGSRRSSRRVIQLK